MIKRVPKTIYLAFSRSNFKSPVQYVMVKYNFLTLISTSSEFFLNVSEILNFHQDSVKQF